MVWKSVHFEPSRSHKGRAFPGVRDDVHSPAAAMTTPASEKRRKREPRLPWRAAAELELGGTRLSARCVNVSVEGMQVSVAKADAGAVQVGDRLIVRISSLQLELASQI